MQHDSTVSGLCVLPPQTCTGPGCPRATRWQGRTPSSCCWGQLRAIVRPHDLSTVRSIISGWQTTTWSTPPCGGAQAARQPCHASPEGRDRHPAQGLLSALCNIGSGCLYDRLAPEALPVAVRLARPHRMPQACPRSHARTQGRASPQSNVAHDILSPRGWAAHEASTPSWLRLSP